MLLARTAQQDAEENVVLEKASVVEEARRKEAALRKAASQPARPGGLAWPPHALHEKRREQLRGIATCHLRQHLSSLTSQ